MCGRGYVESRRCCSLRLAVAGSMKAPVTFDETEWSLGAT